MAKYSIKNQEDFNKIYPTLSTMERGKLGMAFPEYYKGYIADTVKRYKEAQQIKKEERSKRASEKIDQAVQRKVREDYLKAVAGKKNETFQPIKDQASRNKVAQYNKGIQKSANKDTIKQKIINYANQIGLDPKLALAVAQQESGFNPNAVGDSGNSFGLYQIHKPSHPDYKGGTDVDANIKYGLNLLKKHYDTYGGDVDKVLWAYNAGAGNLQKGVLPASTKNYISSIKSIMGNNTPVTGTPTQTASQINVDDFTNKLNSIYSSQNGREGGLNINQDNLYLDLNRPALMSQQMASNYLNNNLSNDYLGMVKQGYQNTYDLSRQAGGFGLQQPEEVRGQEEMMNYNYNPSIRGYADMNNQLAPVPSVQDYGNMIGDIRGYAQIDNQPQNINPDLMSDYVKLMQDLRGNQDKTYQEALVDMQKAQQADYLQNQANMIANIASNSPVKAPSTWVTPWGMVTQQYDQQRPLNLPTNTTTNMDAFKNKLAVKTANQQSNKDLLDRYQSIISANQMSELTGLPSGMFLDKDLYKTYAQYIQNPDISEQAKYKREAGMAPINLSSDLSKQALVNAGNVDVANINALGGINKANIAGEYQLANTQLGKAMDYQKAMMGAEAQQNMNKANLTAQVMIANMNNDTKLKVAQQAGANALQLAQLQDDLYSNNPVRIQNANAQLTNAMANLMTLGGTPEVGFQLYNRIINMGNEDTPSAQPGELNMNLWND